MPRVGYKHTPETIAKIKEAVKGKASRYWLGKKRSLETKQKISKAKKGKPSWNKEKHWSKDFRKKVSKSIKELWKDRRYRDRMVAIHLTRMKGKMELHYNWKGGKSFEPYPKVFNNTLKRIIKEIDDYICQLCGVGEKDHYEKLSIHHIDYDKNNCQISNLITLCRGCNSKANFGRENWERYFQNKNNNRSRRD